MGLVEVLGDIAKQKMMTPGADSACLAAGAEAVDVPIPGTTKQGRLTENIGGASVELTPADLRYRKRGCAG